MLTRTDTSTSAEPKLLPINLCIGDYDRTQPLIDGRVKPRGIDLQVTPSWIGAFCVRPVYEEYDAAEMSFSWYLMARQRREPVIALPIFILRMPVLAYVFVRQDSPITRPSDLIGKRIGSTYYRITVNLWLRGIFQEHYGLAPNQAQWVITTDEEGAGYQVPAGIDLVRRPGVDPFDLLDTGEVDAVFSPEIPESFTAGRSGMRRLFPDAQAEMRSFVQRTGILPMTHTIVVGEKLAQEKPWVVTSLIEAFEEAQRVVDAYWRVDPKHLSFPDGAFFFEQQYAAYGPKPYQHGVEPNRTAIEAFVRYAHQQGYIDSTPAIDGLFFK